MRNQDAAGERRLKVLVVDDEPLARTRLARMLEKVDGATCVGEAGSGDEALARIATTLPDVILLDVEMPGLDGLALARTAGIPPVIFTTAHVQFAAEAFEVDAVDFLAKPVRIERLVVALDKARRRQTVASSTPADRLAVHDKNAVRFVDPAVVVAFRARDKYTDFTHEGRELLVRESLDALEARLAHAGFVRVHRNALVRGDAIIVLETEGESAIVRLADGTTAPVSRRAAPELRRRLGVRKPR
jgi:DNA-binding LytR/AlgR family response regulator